MFQQTSGGNGGGGDGGVLGAAAAAPTAMATTTAGTVKVPPQQQQDKEKGSSPCTNYDVAYFHSYAHLGIHEEMIKDRVRTETYRNAILQHQETNCGKVVVDVGCGTGILSIFCAQAGAKRVYAVDASDIAVQANEVVKANNLSDTIIVLHGRVEDVEIEDKVDVIVSEWMGYMLLYESMLGSVITARDRWLKPGGLILPSYATLYMAPVSHSDRYSESIDFWRNVYGIDSLAGEPLLTLARIMLYKTPSLEKMVVHIKGISVTSSSSRLALIEHLKITKMLLSYSRSSKNAENQTMRWVESEAEAEAEKGGVKHVDCSTITIDELESVSTRFKFKSMMRAPFHGFAFWFDVEFGVSAKHTYSNNAQPTVCVEAPDNNNNNHVMETSQRKKRPNPNDALVLSTAPEDPPTHWQQTLIYFYDPIEVEQDQVIEGSVVLSQSKENPRFMNIHLEYASGGRSFVKESVMR
ncbi:probable protein arginine n-methyltransferase 6 [Phtheirospermum japonicum]|uniref:Probable protein arginine n-methyltransferase 6 n=1 Tax=Phtheirospermum japonicum TaxID=374723 RepID=A0A830CHW6_9LAMI|nr:probable protein arginine n-methyltransferase 6 [Phtheirospermum japonicum]